MMHSIELTGHYNLAGSLDRATRTPYPQMLSIVRAFNRAVPRLGSILCRVSILRK